MSDSQKHVSHQAAGQSARKICVATGTRAEYGLLLPLLKLLRDDPRVELQLLVTGTHLSPEFGLTYRAIIEDGFTISAKVEMLLSSDTPVGISKSMALAQMGAAEAFDRLTPTILVVLGDRFEMFAVTAAAMIANLPVAHLHGGEATEGAVDEAIRHSITKMAHLHFTATEIYRQRVIQLGEQPDRVFMVGTPGLDNILGLELLSQSEFEQSIDFELGQCCVLCTFHPVTLSEGKSEVVFNNLLAVLAARPEMRIIFTYPNADTEGRQLINLIDDFVQQHPTRSKAFVSLGQLRYLSALQYVDLVIGNSSSGLTEAPSFKVATVNIGDRQRGRVESDSVITCAESAEAIEQAVTKALSPEFQQSLATVENAYGSGGASEKIAEVLKTFPLEGVLLKSFYDLPH